MERRVIYFERPGRENTEECVKLVSDLVRNEDYRHVVVASTTGETGILFADALRDLRVNLVIVTHSYGYKEPNTIELMEDNRKRILALGAKILTATMLTHSLETSFSSKFHGLYPTMIIAQTLRRFGEGPKVCCECVMMATDAGLIPEGEEIVSVAGTGRGADTVMIIRSAASKRFLDLRVLEILAKVRA